MRAYVCVCEIERKTDRHSETRTQRKTQRDARERERERERDPFGHSRPLPQTCEVLVLGVQVRLMLMSAKIQLGLEMEYLEARWDQITTLLPDLGTNPKPCTRTHSLCNVFFFSHKQ